MPSVISEKPKPMGQNLSIIKVFPWNTFLSENFVGNVATYPSVGGQRVTRGCVPHERNTHGVATNVYLRKTSKKPEKT